mgnify:CR=1 FL=1|tara:strand:+ start:3127 stop:3723 length:597 start_codon:yes stop_codon:yes gene_type:complete
MAINPKLAKVHEIIADPKSPGLRDAVGLYLRKKYKNDDIESLQTIHRDKEGIYLNAIEPDDGWDDESLSKAKEEVYDDVLKTLKGGKIGSSDNLKEPPMPNAKPPSDDKVVEEDIIDPFGDDEDDPITPPEPEEEEEEEEPEEEEPRESPQVRHSSDKAALLEQLLSGGISEERVIELIEEHATKLIDKRFDKLKEAL